MRPTRFGRTALKSLVRAILFLAIAAFAGIGRRNRFESAAGELDPRRILIIRLDLLGDVVNTLPLATALKQRYPDSRITMMTLPYTAPLARMCPAVDEVIPVDSNAVRTVRGVLNVRTWRAYYRACQQVRACNFDLCFSVYGRTSSFCALLSGARRTIGYQLEAYPGTLTNPVAGGRHRERIPETEYVLRLALAAHASPAPELPTLVVAGAASPSLDAMLAAHGIEPADRLVVIHAGSINGSAKRWPSGYWARFADALVRDAGVRIALIGAKADSAIAKEVRTRVSVPIADLTGQTDIPQLAALLCRADLVASGDSGPLHLANALGRPILAVFGPTDVRIYGPYRPSNAALLHRADLACSPCYTLSAIAECPLGDPICMRLVTPERMVASARALLSGEEV